MLSRSPFKSVTAPVATSGAALRSSQGDEGDGETCSICFEPWTTSGEHRLATLRCGHLFGYTCIDRWVKGQGQGAKCPQVSVFMSVCQPWYVWGGRGLELLLVPL